MKNLITIKNAMTASASKQMLDNVEHLVVPVVALVEGVMNKIYYAPEQINNLVQSWSGVPVPVSHPEKFGLLVSANSPEYENTVNIGKLYNVSFVDNKLKGEIWVNIEKANRLGFGDIITHLEAGNKMEVSTGLFAGRIPENGEFNGKPYTHKAVDIRPDHLALLPNEIGACSLEDGCGAMVNKDETCCDDCASTEAKTLRNKLTDAVKLIGSKLGLVSNEAGHGDIRRQLQSIIDGEKGKDDSWPWVVDVFDSTFIYEADGQLYERDYTENDNVVSVGATKTKVVVETTYKPVKGLLGNNADKTSKEFKMDKTALVEALIANKSNSFTEADKEMLTNMDEDALKKMQPVENVDETPDGAEQPAEPAANALSDGERATLNRLQKKENERIAHLREVVVNGQKGMTEEIVANMDVEALEVLANSIEPQADYSGQAGGQTSTAQANTQVRKVPSVLLGNDKETEDKANG